MGDEPLAVGIDIGTARSAVAVWRDGRAHLVPNAEGQLHTPSVVTFDASGTAIVGSRAIDLGILHPERSFHGFKHLFGLAGRTVAIDGRHWSPEDLAVLILRKLKADAESHLGQEIDRAVLTAPVAFALQQRASLVRAAAHVGIRVMRIVDEPAAAALGLETAVRGVDEEVHVFVFDLGGGTLDVSVVEVGPGGMAYDVKAVAGDTHLGGTDWDIRMATAVAEWFEDETGLTLSADPVAWGRLVRACERAKIDLASSSSTTVVVPMVGRDANGLHDLERQVTRQEVASWTTDLDDRCRALCEQALADADLREHHVVIPLLVGGGSRLFNTAALVEDVIGRPVDRRLDPDEAVASGAAVQAAIMTHALGDALLLAVIPTSLDVRWGRRTLPTILRNSTLPTRRTTRLWLDDEGDLDDPLVLTQGDPAIGQVVDALVAIDLRWLEPPLEVGEPFDVTVEVGAGVEVCVTVHHPATDRPELVIDVDEQTARQARRAYVHQSPPPEESSGPGPRAPMSDPPLSRAFVSYSRADRPYVERLVGWLSDAGLRPWWDDDVEVGEQSLLRVADELRSSGAVVVVMSPESTRSTWVAREIQTAQDAGVPVLPLLLGGWPLFQVAELQYEDVSDGAMPSERFVERVRSLCRAPRHGPG